MSVLLLRFGSFYSDNVNYAPKQRALLSLIAAYLFNSFQISHYSTSMASNWVAAAAAIVCALLLPSYCLAADPYTTYEFVVSYKTLSPLGVPQQVTFCSFCHLAFLKFAALSDLKMRLGFVFLGFLVLTVDWFPCLLVYVYVYQVIVVNDQFPGPVINVTTNYNVVVNVKNHLDEELLLTWYANGPN